MWSVFSLGKKNTSGTWVFGQFKVKKVCRCNVSPFPGVFLGFQVPCGIAYKFATKKNSAIFFRREASHPENLFPFPSILVPNPLQTRSPTCSGT